MLIWLSESWGHLTERRVGRRFVALDVVKVISVQWIIIAHSYNFAIQWLTLEQVGNVFASPLTLWIGNPTFAVDNFFFISGLLVRLERVKAHGPASSVRAAIGRLAARYVRLAPSLMLLILISIVALADTNASIMFSGWCRNKWPLNALMAHNFIETRTICFSHSWYVAVNIQLFALLQVTELLAACLRVSNKCVDILISLLIIATQLCIAHETYTRRLPALPLVPVERPELMIEYYAALYIKPHYWLVSFLTGFLAATKFASQRDNCSRCLCGLALVSMTALILWPLPYFRDSIPMSPIGASLYAFVARPLWCCCLVILLSQADASYITKLAFWTPISRLTYSLYLIHPVIMATFYGNRTETFRFSHLLLAYFTVGHTFFSLICAFALFMTFESPITRMLDSKSRSPIDSNVSALRTRQKSQS